MLFDLSGFICSNCFSLFALQRSSLCLVYTYDNVYVIILVYI